MWPGDLTLRDLGLKFLQHIRKNVLSEIPKPTALRAAVF